MSPVPTDLINITAAATRLGVSLDVMRDWADAGGVYFGSDFFALDVWRDPRTNIRHFSRAQIESLVARRARRFVREPRPHPRRAVPSRS